MTLPPSSPYTRTSPHTPWWKRWPNHARHVAVLIYQRFFDERCLIVAASLSYTSLLAMVPVLAVTMAILSAFSAFDQARHDLQRLIFDNFAPHVGDQAIGFITSLVDNAAGLTAVGVVGIVITALLLMTTIEEALNTIFRVKNKRPLLSRLIGFWTILTITPLLLAFFLSVSHSFITPMIHNLSLPMRGVEIASPLIITTIIFTLIFIIVPYRRIALSHAVIGAMVTAIGLEILKNVFTIYVASGTYATLYGALAGIPLFLIWMYLSWTIVLFGALFTDTLNHDNISEPLIEDIL